MTPHAIPLIAALALTATPALPRHWAAVAGLRATPPRWRNATRPRARWRWWNRRTR